jgi:hypothetical protein
MKTEDLLTERRRSAETRKNLLFVSASVLKNQHTGAINGAPTSPIWFCRGAIHRAREIMHTTFDNFWVTVLPSLGTLR